METIASYILSAYSFLFTEPLAKLLDVGHQSQSGNPIPSFDEKLLIDLCTGIKNIFEKENNILELSGDFVIVGDIHGSLHDLLRILNFIQENPSKILFLGDYVDRGNFSLECTTILFALKALYPESIYLIRGNHEFDSICRQYGFRTEILDYHDPKKLTISPSKNTKNKSTQPEPEENDYYPYNQDKNCYKYTDALYTAFVTSFSYLPVAAILNGTTFCIHGGLSPKIESLNSLNTLITRPVQTFEESPLLTEVVWSDPSPSANRLYDINPRGNGFLFNKKAVADFLRQNSFTRMIRAHQYAANGYLYNFGDQCITVFSASCYDKMHNSSAVIQLFQIDDTVKITAFVPLRRLEKREAVYYKVEAFNPRIQNIHFYFSFLHPNLRPIKKIRKISVQKSDGNISIQKGRSRIFQLTRPKFITNQRGSYQFPKKEMLIDAADKNRYKSDIDSNDNEVAARIFPASFFSARNRNNISSYSSTIGASLQRPFVNSNITDSSNNTDLNYNNNTDLNYNNNTDLNYNNSTTNDNNDTNDTTNRSNNNNTDLNYNNNNDTNDTTNRSNNNNTSTNNNTNAS